MKIWSLLLLCIALSCPGPARAAPAPLPAPAEVSAIPDDLRRALRAQGITVHLPAKARLDRLVRFIFSADGLGIVYRHDATHSVAETYQTRTANCLSLTLLTVALAREVGLNAYGMAVENALMWQRDGDVVYRTNHVYAGVDVAPRRYGVDVAEDSVLMRRFGDPITDERLVALFYNNRAVERLEAGDLDAADRYMQASLDSDPRYATSWSNAGALAARRGDLSGAGKRYQHALSLDPEHAATLSNLVSLHERRGDAAAAARFRTRLARVEARDPFHHFQLALMHERRSEYRAAARRYRQAIDLHPVEHRFHYGLARVQLAVGDRVEAARSLERARAVSGVDMQARYSTKLGKLRMPPG